MTISSSSDKPRKKYDYAAEKKAMAELSNRLEHKYADAGLRIVQCFDGISPVQASGYLGREVFYFRFRSDIASLQVGVPDYEKPKREKRDQALSYAQRLESAKVALEAGEISQAEYEETKWALSIDPPPREVDPFYPDIVSKSARIEGVTGKRYAGSLSRNHLEFIFCELMDSLTTSTE